MNQPPPRHDQNSIDHVIEAFRQMEVPALPPADFVLSRLAERATGHVEPAATRFPLTRSILMRHPFRYAVLASMLAAVLGGFLFTGVSTPALADVLKAAGKHKLVKYKITQTTEDRQGTGDGVDIAYADLRAPRFRSQSDILTLNRTVEGTSVWVHDERKGESLHVLTETVIEDAIDDKIPDSLKEHLRSGMFPRKEARLFPAMTDFTPATDTIGKSLLENLHELEKHKDVTAVRDRRDGKSLLKYRLEDGKTTTILWVDATTELPVRMEREIIDHTPHILRNHWVLTDFQWDPELKEIKNLDDLFSTTPPAGYKLTDERKPKAEK